MMFTYNFTIIDFVVDYFNCEADKLPSMVQDCRGRIYIAKWRHEILQTNRRMF